MYFGEKTVIQAMHRDKYFPGIGTKSVYAGKRYIVKHIYVCDHCGQRFASPEAAIEPFYCHNETHQTSILVSIDA